MWERRRSSPKANPDASLPIGTHGRTKPIRTAKTYRHGQYKSNILLNILYSKLVYYTNTVAKYLI